MGILMKAEPSRFLTELPEDDLEWAYKNPVDKSEQQARSRENIASLKAMLSG